MQVLKNSKELLNLQSKAILHEAKQQRAKRLFKHFVKWTKADYDMQWFHELLCETIQDFIDGKIKKLMIFMPPQHGKSELVSRRLPSMLLGLNPNLRIAACSYGSSLAQEFNKDVQNCIISDEFMQLYPNTKLKENSDQSSGKSAQTNKRFDVVGFKGFYKCVGVGGGLTGTSVDIGIIDDVIKDAKEADSLTYRNNVWNWYVSVFLSRLHNDSQQLLTFTRWHEDDLAGRILADKTIIGKGWHILTLQGIKEIGGHSKDLRNIGEALWENRHSAEKIKANPPRFFNALYQQNPKRTEGGLCIPRYEVIDEMPSDLRKVGLCMDFGWSKPSALLKCGIREQGKRMQIFVDEWVYGTHLENDKVADLVQANNPNSLTLVADSARADSIHDLNKIFRNKNISIRVKGAKKGSGSIKDGLLLINGCDLFITRRSNNLKTELDNYSYIDLGGGKYSDNPIDDFNHAIDALRYYVLEFLPRPERGIYKTT
jgi:hypothetical protein